MHRTETTTLTLNKPGTKPRVFEVTATTVRKIEKLLAYDHEKKEKLIPAEVVFPELADDRLRPAAILRGSRYKEEITQVELAKRLGIRQSHLSEMENAKRPIGKEMARRLAQVLKCNYKVFL